MGELKSKACYWHRFCFCGILPDQGTVACYLKWHPGPCPQAFLVSFSAVSSLHCTYSGPSNICLFYFCLFSDSSGHNGNPWSQESVYFAHCWILCSKNITQSRHLINICSMNEYTHFFLGVLSHTTMGKIADKNMWQNPVSIMCLHLVGVLEIIDLFGVYIS